MSSIFFRKTQFSLLAIAALFLFVSVGALGQTPPLPEKTESRSTVIALSSDGNTLAIGRSSQDVLERNGHVELWDLKTGELRKTITGFDGQVSFITFDPDGQTLVTASFEVRDSKIQEKPKERDQKIVTEVKWWDVATGEFKKKESLEGSHDMETVVSPDGNVVALIKRYMEVELAGGFRRPIDRTNVNAARGRGSIETLEIKVQDLHSRDTKLKNSSNSVFLTAFVGPHLARSVFSSDGRLLAVPSAGELKLFDVNVGSKIQTLKNLKGNPLAVAFSPDGRTIAVASGKTDPGSQLILETEITVWDIASGKLLKNLHGKGDAVSSLQFAGNSNVLLLGTLEYEADRTVGTLKVWDLTTNRLATFNVHDGQAVSSVALIANQPALVLQSGDDVEIRDTRTWTIKHSFTPKDEGPSKGSSRFVLSVKQVSAIGFSSDGISVSGVLPDEGLRLWDSRTGGVTREIKELDPQSRVARSSHGRFLGELRAGKLRLWDLNTGAATSYPVNDSSNASAFALSADGDRYAFAEGSVIKLQSVSNESSTLTLNGHADTVERIEFSDSSNTLVSNDDSGVIKVWDAKTGQTKQTISTGAAVTALVVDRSGNSIASSGPDFVISLWDSRSAALQMKLRKHEGTVNALAFSPDGRLLASGGDDRTVVLWDLNAGRSKQTLKGHEVTVTSIAFSPDGQYLASGSGNATVVLWTVSNGKIERILR